MTKVLSRPMFKMGGVARNARNTGILSGFEDGGNVRRNLLVRMVRLYTIILILVQSTLIWMQD